MKTLPEMRKTRPETEEVQEWCSENKHVQTLGETNCSLTKENNLAKYFAIVIIFVKKVAVLVVVIVLMVVGT